MSTQFSDTQEPVVEISDDAEQYWQGYDKHFNGYLLSEIDGQYEEFGWWEAWQHEQDTDDLEEWLEDFEWLRWGC